MEDDGPPEDDTDEESEDCPDDESGSDCQTGNDDDGDPPDWAKVLLIALGAASVGSVGIAATRRPREGDDVPDTWEELARKEYAKPEEPISARASDLSKIGAPVAAFITAVLAALGGWVAKAPEGHTIIAVAIIVAVAVGGLFYVFAADFRSRAAVSVARFENLCKHSRAETKANKMVLDAADAKVKCAEEVSAVENEHAEKREKDAEEAAAKADASRKAADAKAAEATKRIEEADDKVNKLAVELADTREQLRRCIDESRPQGPAPSAPPTYLTLGGVDAVAGHVRTKVYGIESVGGEIIRYLVRTPDGRLRWVPEAEVSDVGAPPPEAPDES